MNNTDFLATLKSAFGDFLTTGSRSNKKLITLHPKVAYDILKLLGPGYTVKSLGVGDGREAEVQGRYYEKKVDITFYKRGKPVAGLGVKMVMQNYAQNSNNYFENMMGETANLRSNKVPYFQLFAIPDKIPYYDEKNNITKWEGFSPHHAKKYCMMSNDNIETFMHTPTKTLLFVYHLPDPTIELKTKNDYYSYYAKNLNSMKFQLSTENFGTFNDAVVYNDYGTFVTKVAHYILSI